MDKPVFLFVTGGVISSLGKGLTASSIGLLLERQGFPVVMMKLDPYLNRDPGTMSPCQHGEVYVTDDGIETDLDLGHYCRFTQSPLNRSSAATAGQIYEEVLKKERLGDYLGSTVQVIPHVTDEIKRRLELCAKQLQKGGFVIIEIGGTVGDIESLPFLEAIRQFHYERRYSCFNLHVTYVPYIASAGEIKTKPTQHSVQALRQLGLSPDLILCRTEKSISPEAKAKIRLFCNIEEHSVFELPDVPLIYDVPLMLHKQNIEESILKRIGLQAKEVDLSDWEQATRVSIPNPPEVRIGVVGKYMKLQDAYKSVYEALYHASCRVGCRLHVEKIDAELVEQNGDSCFNNLHGCLVPGGFGIRGFEGKIRTAQYCREQHIPYFGICLGMQVLAVEFARHVLGMKQAHSTEMDPHTTQPVISLLSEQHRVIDLGGTMRLGSYTCILTTGSKAQKVYDAHEIQERHRHRYEFNNDYKDVFEKHGALCTGTGVKGELCEIIELTDHPWMIGVQFHPEFGSKPTKPHPLFVAFVQAALDRSRL